MLSELLARHREELLSRARERLANRAVAPAVESELFAGLGTFLDQLQHSLVVAHADKQPESGALLRTAHLRGADFFRLGLAAARIVEDYGDLCEVVTGFANERKVSISNAEFRTLKLCLDEATAAGVTEYVRLRERGIAAEAAERLGVLAHEMRNLLNTAMLSVSSMKHSNVGIGGKSGAILERSLTGLHTLIDRSFAAVRLEVGVRANEAVSVHAVIEEVVVGARLLAQSKGISLQVSSVDENVVVVADWQILAAAVTNLLHNAFKFTLAGTPVTLTVSATSARVLIEVEDECGGLPPGRAGSLLRPFVQRGVDRSGLGLGLSICVKAVQSMDGELRVRDLPGKGCVFTLDLPRKPAAASEAVEPTSTDGSSAGGSGQNVQPAPPSLSSLVILH